MPGKVEILAKVEPDLRSIDGGGSEEFVRTSGRCRALCSACNVGRSGAARAGGARLETNSRSNGKKPERAGFGKCRPCLLVKRGTASERPSAGLDFEQVTSDRLLRVREKSRRRRAPADTSSEVGHSAVLLEVVSVVLAIYGANPSSKVFLNKSVSDVFALTNRQRLTARKQTRGKANRASNLE